MHLSSSSITGTKVRNGQGDDLGKIEDLMVDVSSGEVSYAVLSFGGFLGIGDKLFAVPLRAMTVDTKDEEFILNESKERLENAPGFDKDHWPNTADPEWHNQVNTYYNTH
jgi:sporulation protein YlmC with PRC-barrel domain